MSTMNQASKKQPWYKHVGGKNRSESGLLVRTGEHEAFSDLGTPLTPRSVSIGTPTSPDGPGRSMQQVLNCFMAAFVGRLPFIFWPEALMLKPPQVLLGHEGHQYRRAANGLLHMVNELRAVGADVLLDLPTVVVCGQQSAGKSSVVEVSNESGCLLVGQTRNFCRDLAAQHPQRQRTVGLATCICFAMYSSLPWSWHLCCYCY